jgi:hypothetical protein
MIIHYERFQKLRSVAESSRAHVVGIINHDDSLHRREKVRPVLSKVGGPAQNFVGAML